MEKKNGPVSVWPFPARSIRGESSGKREVPTCRKRPPPCWGRPDLCRIMKKSPHIYPDQGNPGHSQTDRLAHKIWPFAVREMCHQTNQRDILRWLSCQVLRPGGNSWNFCVSKSFRNIISSLTYLKEFDFSAISGALLEVPVQAKLQ